MARLPHRRQSSLVRFRPILRLARRLSDVSDVLSLGSVHLAEPRAQTALAVSSRPTPATGRAIRLCPDRRDAACALSGLPRDDARAQPGRLWTALSGATLLAQRADVVPMAAPGVDYRGRRAPPRCPPLG